MLVEKKSPSLNLRELTGYLFILTLLLLAVVSFWVLARMFQPRGDWHQVAAITELDPTRPSVFSLTAADGTRIWVWLAYSNGTWRAYDGLTPTVFPQNCQYGWQFVTNRFEDPCSGAKFEIDGTYIKHDFAYPRILATDLIQYGVELRDDQLWVNLEDKIKPSQIK